MKHALLKLAQGCEKRYLSKDELELATELIDDGLLKDGEFLKLSERFIVGVVDVNRSGTGFLQVLTDKNQKDLLVPPRDLGPAEKGDLVVAKLEFSRGKHTARVVYIVEKAFPFIVVYTKKHGRRTYTFNIKTHEPIELSVPQKQMRDLPDEAVFKIDNTTKEIVEVLGTLADPMVDEKISLALFDRIEEHPKKCILEAEAYGHEVDKTLYLGRVDLTRYPFVTIDPVTAKDFDDAIYFDVDAYELYVAIADVSEYVRPYSCLDEEAKRRGFSVYFPHKAVPMLPRNLSENICSLKEGVYRLTFTFKIKINPETLEVECEELFESVIKSARRYNYDRIDELFNGTGAKADKQDKTTLKWLAPLDELTKKLKAKRLKNGFDFKSDEVKMDLNEAQEIVSTIIEEQTRSHALIEDCMLLANIAAANRMDKGLFRCHGEPKKERLDSLLRDLLAIGIQVKRQKSSHDLLRAVQASAEGSSIQRFVDKLVIRSMQQAVYSSDNIGHFGLGFKNYTHFTSPIRRYSDLLVHRLLKAIIANDEKQKSFLLSDIEPAGAKLSELEREAAKAEWDFRDRKFARWALANLGGVYECVVTEIDNDKFKDAVAALDDKLIGARIYLDTNLGAALFDRVLVRIVAVDIAKAKIEGRIEKVLHSPERPTVYEDKGRETEPEAPTKLQRDIKKRLMAANKDAKSKKERSGDKESANRRSTDKRDRKR